MCGIAGYIATDPCEFSVEKLKHMTDAIAHRGPDGEGHWVSEDGHCGLGHRRLSIIDLSDAGSQPMHYLNRYVIVYNGEVYNYVELKKELQQKGYSFSSHTDTEVLLALYHERKEECLQAIDGMFAFAIYDKQEKKLFCARDRFGEKPFFYSYQKGGHFIFGSEMKALWAAGVAKQVNNRMLYNYLANDFVENPDDQSETFYSNCFRLPQSSYLIIDAHTCDVLSLHKYWHVNPQSDSKQVSVTEVAERFRHLFHTSVERRLRSDVPVGSSLSGGLDSSAVVCEIDKILNHKPDKIQKTFSARFKNFAKDEGGFMQAVIDVTRAEPHFVFPSEDDLPAELEKVMYHQEEPFQSASIYAQYKVMQLAKQQNVTVLLDGQGADEVLAGYHSYYYTFFSELKKNNPELYKKEFAAYKALHKNNTINGVMKKDLKFFLKTGMPSAISSLKKLQQSYLQKVAPFFNNDFFAGHHAENFSVRRQFSSLNEALHYSTMTSGLHVLLRYADRNSMAHSREVRLPFLYHELVNFAFSLPSTFKIHNGWTKWIMRESLKNLLPEKICWRKDKIGYEPPQSAWLQKPELKEIIHDSTELLVKNKILNASVLKNRNGHTKNHASQKSWQRLMAAKVFE